MASLEEFEKVVKAELETNFKLPPAFIEGGHIVGGELLRWDEGWMPQVIIEFGDREVVLYDISAMPGEEASAASCTKLFASFHRVESDGSKQVSISACKGCDAVLVLRKNRTWLPASRATAATGTTTGCCSARASCSTRTRASDARHSAARQ